MIKPLVSVVIPTYNSQRTIGICLKSVREQTYSSIEVIVMDKNSSDRTSKIAESYGAKIFKLNSERTEAKNFGVKKALGEYVCFIDSDMELTPNVIEECVNLIEKDVKIGGIIVLVAHFGLKLEILKEVFTLGLK